MCANSIWSISTGFLLRALPAALLARRARIPTSSARWACSTAGESQNRRPMAEAPSFRFLESRILAGRGAVHYTSAQEQVEVGAIWEFYAKPLIIPNPVDLPSAKLARLRPAERSQSHSLPLPLRPQRLRTSASFRPSSLPGPEATLVLAGAGDPALVAHLKSETQLGIASHVSGPASSPARQMGRLDGADVFVLPSYSENFGIALVKPWPADVPWSSPIKSASIAKSAAPKPAVTPAAPAIWPPRCSTSSATPDSAAA